MCNLHIVSSNGYGNIDIKVSENISIEKLKENIEKIFKTSSSSESPLSNYSSSNSLYYGSHQLNDEQTLKDYNIKDGSIIYFSMYKY